MAKQGARFRRARNGNGNGESHPPVLIGLIAAGAAIGAAGALVARRRNRARWAEYEPSKLQSDAESMVGMEEGGHPHGAAKLAHWAKENTRTAVGTVRGKMPGGGGKTMDEINERVADTGTDVTRDLTGEPVPTPGSIPGEAPGTQSGRAAEGAPGSGGSMSDEVDAVLRSSKERNSPKSDGPSKDTGM